ncbi:MAG: pyruvate kinase [Myxococcales bacterium]|nr:pyruvate kinase [Myxococcales bacterium]
MRKARIICTLGPSSSQPEVLEAMVRAGMDVARLNFSHGTHDEHRRRVETLRAAAKKAGRTVAILQDVQGPKIRLGRFEGGLAEVKSGATVTVTTRKVLGTSTVLPTPITTLPKDVKKGDPILLDDGRVRLEVRQVKGQDVTCRVLVGGALKDHKGLNLPGALVSVPTLTPKDRVDLKFGQELGVDYVALSFVRTPEDVLRAKKLLRARGTPVIAKIEKPQAVEALDSIAAVADGVMVARGDLGVEMPLEKLPALQKAMVKKVNLMGGVVIVATEMLESMVQNVRPTRAEVSDVANAIFDGADAVMLSGETASGRWPVEAVRTMARIVEEAEVDGVVRPRSFEWTRDISTGVAAAAVEAADRLGSELVVAHTESGRTARLISELRPRATILGITPRPEVMRRMALYWGVQSHLAPRLASTDEMIAWTKQLVRRERLAPRGSTVVLVAGQPLNEAGRTNLLTVRKL